MTHIENRVELTVKRGLRHKNAETRSLSESEVVSLVENDYDWVPARQIGTGSAQLGEICEIPLDNRDSQA